MKSCRLGFTFFFMLCMSSVFASRAKLNVSYVVDRVEIGSHQSKTNNAIKAMILNNKEFGAEGVKSVIRLKTALKSLIVEDLIIELVNQDKLNTKNSVKCSKHSSLMKSPLENKAIDLLIHFDKVDRANLNIYFSVRQGDKHLGVLEGIKGINPFDFSQTAILKKVKDKNIIKKLRYRIRKNEEERRSQKNFSVRRNMCEDIQSVSNDHVATEILESSRLKSTKVKKSPKKQVRRVQYKTSTSSQTD